MRFSRRSFLLTGLGASAALSGYARLVEPEWLQVERKIAPFPGIRAPLRVLHLTDLHAGADTPFELLNQAIALGLKRNPDIICLTGDYISLGVLPDLERFRETLKPLAAHHPVYASFGNHDGGLWAARAGGIADIGPVKESMEAVGIKCLRNSSSTVEVAGASINIVGVGDHWSADVASEKAFAVLSASGHLTIVLSHNPDTVRSLAPYPWNLMLCGHTHGGQMVVPLLGVAPYAPVQDRRFIEGLCPFDDRLVHVSRGIGSIMGIRFACRPEVSILDLQPAS